MLWKFLSAEISAIEVTLTGNYQTFKQHIFAYLPVNSSIFSLRVCVCVCVGGGGGVGVWVCVCVSRQGSRVVAVAYCKAQGEFLTSWFDRVPNFMTGELGTKTVVVRQLVYW